MTVPSTYPIQERIILDVVETCEEISTRDGTNAYHNDVRKVSRGGTGLDNVDPPFIIVAIDENDTDDRYSSGTHGVNQEELRLTLAGFVESADEPEHWLQLLVRDVRTALMLDPERNSLATHTHIGGATYFSNESAAGRSHFTLGVRVVYRTNASNLEAVIS